MFVWNVLPYCSNHKVRKYPSILLTTLSHAIIFQGTFSVSLEQEICGVFGFDFTQILTWSDLHNQTSTPEWINLIWVPRPGVDVILGGAACRLHSVQSWLKPWLPLINIFNFYCSHLWLLFVSAFDSDKLRLLPIIRWLCCPGVGGSRCEALGCGCACGPHIRKSAAPALFSNTPSVSGL